MSYTKLFNSIITSTIWTEDDKTRILWITMLALADKNGEVQASIPGLARVAGMSVPDCERAINKFLGPDKYSRTPDDEGRRIEAIDGGFALLNHGKYREMASREESISSNAERQKRFRDRKNRNAPVTDSNAFVTPSNASVTDDMHIAEADTEAEAYTEEREREEAPPALAHVVPTGRKFPDHAATIARINALRPEWAKPAQWTGMELHSLHDALGQLEEFTDEDWDGLKRYFGTYLEKGAGYWQPKSRGQFVGAIADVFANYTRWATKGGTITTKRKSLA